MTIEIRINDNGRHEVVKSVPMVLGTFEDRAYAELFAIAVGRGDEPSSSSPRAELSPAPVPEKPPRVTVSLPAAPPAPVVASEPPQEPSEADWNTALDRLEAGENCKAVAMDVGLPFGSLRAKWAGCVASGARKKPEMAKPPTKPAGRETEDSPVSGGVGAVLARGRGVGVWSAEEDEKLLKLDGPKLLEFARDTGRSVSECDRRQAALREKMQRLMSEE